MMDVCVLNSLPTIAQRLAGTAAPIAKLTCLQVTAGGDIRGMRPCPPIRHLVGGRGRDYELVAVVLRLVGTIDRHTEIVRLFLAKLSQFCANFLQVQAGHFFVQMFG
jgi:hypothetical protein